MAKPITESNAIHLNISIMSASAYTATAEMYSITHV